MLHGDEVRVCWEAMATTEPFEGLFRDLGVVSGPDGPEPPADRRITGDAMAASAPVSRWPSPSTHQRTAAGHATQGGRMLGLSDATYVPARSMAITAPGPADRRSPDAEAELVLDGGATGQRGLDADERVTGQRADLGEADH